MTDLIKALEEAEKGSRTIDWEIHSTVAEKWWAGCEWNEFGYVDVDGKDPHPDQITIFKGGRSFYNDMPRYSTSLDAALALAERVLPGDSPGVSRNVFHGYWSAWLHRNVDGACHLVGDACTASTPALALCAAILRASEQERGG